jgi:broad specificity phosphatase PhoE
MVIAIRHGETDWNAKEAHGTEDAEILRGNLDVPLNNQGKQKVLESAHEICPRYPVHEVRSSPDYQRATETRHILAEVCQVPEVDAPEFAPYDPGSLSGKPISLIGDILEYLIDIPFLAAPGGGQSFEEYFQNFASAWHSLYSEYGGDDSKAVVVVLFGNEFRALPAILQGKPVDKHATTKVKPGEYVVVP